MKLSLQSERYKRVEKNLSLENIAVDKQVALRAIEIVNAKKPLTKSMIQEAIKLGKV
ncbi:MULTISPECIES: hypothetical protein [unclassified Exiguobacterium]|uniref:hypothetical protein n=1 Tax=unclassified Exiguobacterium TaxID=2644629 RepID=UPI0013006BA0|nr:MULTISPECIES: hypothetical protein [unclassified Exiguobacterium]